jgi:hypothetical protein
MVTENLLQNILDADTSRQATGKEKMRKKTIVRTAEQSAAEKRKEKENYRPYSRVDGAWGETWGWGQIG